ncbi:hypothetical protein Tco_0409008 [Tanacetum coccineum]
MESSSSNSEKSELQRMQLEERQLHSKCMAWFKKLKSHLGTPHKRSLLRYLEELDELIDERILKYEELRMKEREQSIVESTTSSEQQNECSSSMENKDTVSSCYDSEEQHMQQLQMQASRQKEMCMKWFRALQGNTRFLLRGDFISLNSIDEGKNTQIFKDTMIHDIYAIKKYLIEEILHEHEIEKRFKLQSKDVQINLVQALDASLVVTERSGTELENSSSETAFSRLENENRSSNKESSNSGNDADADIGLSYDSDTVSEVRHDMFENVFPHRIQNYKQPKSIPDTYVVNKNNSNIISDILNMDPNRDKEEHDYVDDEQQRAFFASLVNNLKCDVEKCNKVNRDAQQANALLTDEVSFYTLFLGPFTVASCDECAR